MQVADANGEKIEMHADGLGGSRWRWVA